jgi:hypothetical protein
MRPMHNLMVGLQHCGKYKMALNDLYVERVQGVNGVQNPNPREIVRATHTSSTCLLVVNKKINPFKFTHERYSIICLSIRCIFISSRLISLLLSSYLLCYTLAYPPTLSSPQFEGALESLNDEDLDAKLGMDYVALESIDPPVD